MTRNSALACWMVTPGLSFAPRKRKWPWFTLLRSACSARKRSVSGSPGKSGPITPITVKGSELILMARPIMPGSPPKRRFQRPLVSTATRAAPILRGREGAAYQRSHAQHAKVSLRDMDAPDLLGVAAAGEIHAWPHEIVDGDRLQQAGLPDGGKLRYRHGGGAAGLELPGDIDQAIAVVIG